MDDTQMYKKILVPTDGSEIAGYAVKSDIKLAKAMKSEVIGLYVIDLSAFADIPAGGLIDNMKKLLEEEGKKTLDVVKVLGKQAGVKFGAVLKDGLASKTVVNVAEEKGVDLIVMDTAGRNGLNKILLGSVTEKVLKIAHCPVAVVWK